MACQSESTQLKSYTFLTRQIRELEDCLHSLAVVGAWPVAEGSPPLTVALLRAARPQMLNAHAATHFQLLRIVWSVAALEVLVFAKHQTSLEPSAVIHRHHKCLPTHVCSSGLL